MVISRLLFKTCVGVHVLPLHVEAVPAAAALESVYPTVQLLQSTCSAVSQSVPALPSNNVGVPLGQVQILALHVDAVPAAAASESVYPVLQALQST